jgi:Kef-type K+ transport system membrane component KefB
MEEVAHGASHGDPAAAVVLAVALILLAAKLGGEIAIRLRQPAVLGELLAGVALGNVDLLGLPSMDFLGTDGGVDLLARIGVLVLLFDVGLESTVGQMLKVGVSSLLVALVGVFAPFALGYGAAAFIVPEVGFYAHLFVGATLTATSVGISARVLKDIKKSDSAESRIILGAAVIDDVLGLVILAVVSGVVAGAATGEGMSAGEVLSILAKSLGFLVVALVFGVMFSRRLYDLASKLNSHGVLLAISLAFCFLLSWAADAMGLASIVGAFAAGLVLEQVHYRGFLDKGEHPLEELIAPIASFLVPIFFVVMGVRTDLRSFADPSVLVLAGALTLVAVIGKVICGVGVVGAGIDRLAIGIGMIPRGEVGLIFANVGLALMIGGAAVVSPSLYAAIVVMVIATTLVTPPLLKWRLGA